jgi:hypothetical protein
VLLNKGVLHFWPFAKNAVAFPRMSRSNNCERPHSSLDYRTPEQFRQKTGYANVESTERFPHLHSLDGGCELISKPNQNRETLVING